jgi:hypothetical protein
MLLAMTKIQSRGRGFVGGATIGANHMGAFPNEVIQIAVVGRYGLALRFEAGASGVWPYSRT